MEHGALPSGPLPVGDLLSYANLELGKTIARGCELCHSMSTDNAREDLAGPTLWNIVGRNKASSPDFENYSDEMLKRSGTWTFDELNGFMLNPRAFIPGTKMRFSGIPDEQQRIALIAYLRTLSDSPVPLP